MVGLEALEEAEDALVHLLVVHPDGLEAVVDLVAEDALHDVEVVVQEHGRGALLGFLA